MAIGIYETHDLMRVVETLRPPTSYWLDLCFGTTFLSDSEFIDFDVVDRGRRLAPFVAPTAQGVPLVQQGYTTRKFKPAYIKPKDMVDPARLLRRQAGESIAGNLSAQQREDAIVADILQTHRFAIERRWEWMACRAVVDGAVTIGGSDYPEVSISFGRLGSLSKNLTGNARWSDTTNSNPLVDLENWMTEVHRESGYAPTRVTMGLNAWRAFYNHPKVEKMLETRRGSANVVETGPGTGLPFQWRATLLSNGLEIYTYNDIYEDDAGTAVNFLDQDTIVLSSPAVDGVRAFGAIMDRKSGWTANPFFPKMWEQEDPSGLYLMTQSAPLMIPTRPNASLKAKVLNAS
jgi:hypothetical protein